MGRAGPQSWVRSVGVASIAAFPVVIAAVTRYRWAASLLAVAGFDRFYGISWTPKTAQMPRDAAFGFAATVGVGVAFSPFMCGIWPVLTGAIAMPDGSALSTSNVIMLAPGGSVDLGGWAGDLILTEEANLGADGDWDWTAGPTAALLGDSCFNMTIDPLLSLGGLGVRVNPAAL